MTSKSNADVDQATAGASGAAVGADQQTAGATGGTFSETGHKAATDVNTEEAISSYNQFAVQRYLDRAANNQDKLDHLIFQHFQNSIQTADMVAKDALRDRAIATDRLWNINEDSGFAVQLAAVVSSAVKQALKDE